VHHGRHSTALASDHCWHASSLPALAVAWQSAAVAAGELQLVLQKLVSCKQAPLFGSLGIAGVVPASGSPLGTAPVLHAPRSMISAVSVQLSSLPAMHALCPHATLRRSTPCCTTQPQSGLSVLHAAKMVSAIGVSQRLQSQRMSQP